MYAKENIYNDRICITLVRLWETAAAARTLSLTSRHRRELTQAILT